MIEKYSLYYAYKTIGDVLIVNIEPDLWPTSFKKSGDVVAIYNNDKVGVIFFSNHVEKFIPPKKGKSHILRIIRELLTIEPSDSPLLSKGKAGPHEILQV